MTICRCWSIQMVRKIVMDISHTLLLDCLSNRVVKKLKITFESYDLKDRLKLSRLGVLTPVIHLWFFFSPWNSKFFWENSTRTWSKRKSWMCSVSWRVWVNRDQPSRPCSAVWRWLKDLQGRTRECKQYEQPLSLYSGCRFPRHALCSVYMCVTW